jgi:hypothetical protein
MSDVEVMNNIGMLRLLPDQAASQWDALKVLINQSLPEGERNQDALNARMLRMILAGEMSVWICGIEEEDGFNPHLLMTTQECVDEHLGTKSLLIYSFTGLRPLSNEIYGHLGNKMRLYAKAIGCSKIMAYTNEERIRRVCESMGAKTRWFLTFDI